MYQSPIATHGFNHQSLYGQPVANLRQIHEVVWNPNNVTQSTNGVTPYTYSLNTNQQFAPESGNLGKQICPPSMNTNHIKTHSNKTLVNNHRENTLNNPTGTTNNANPSMRQSRNTSLVPNANPDRFLPRQSSLGAMSEIRTAPLKETAKLFTSRSAGTVNDYIQRERKSHTMAPLTRITGPSSNITTSLFASTIAPGDAQVVKASHVSQTASNIPFSSYPQSNDEMTDSSHRDDIDEDNGDDDDDDDAPIIVKVQYDPDAGGPPSEDVIRKAVDNQLKGKSRSSAAAEPIVLNFLNPPAPPRIPSVPIRPQQPIFNRPIPPLPQFINRPQHQVPISPQQENLASIQQRQFDKQLFLQQQQQLQQQHLQFQANQRQQQQKQQRLQFQANQQPQQEQRRQQLQGQQFQLQANQQQQQEQRQQLQLQGQQFQLQANQQPLEQQRQQLHLQGQQFQLQANQQQQQEQRQQLHLQGQQFQLQANQQQQQEQRQQLHLQGQQFQLQGNQKAQQQQRQQQQQGKQFQLQANQQPQQQQQHRQQQEYLLQPQNSRHDLQKFLLQQSQLEQQQKEEKLQQIQKQLKADQHEIQQLIQQQLLLERQQQQQQRYRQLFQQQQRQRQQELQENQQIHSSQQYASLPPMGPRPPRTTSSIPTSPPYQPPITTVPNNESRPPQPCPPAPVPLRNPQEYPTITIQKLPNRNVNSVIPSTSASSGLNAYSKHSYQYIPNTFIPIHAEGPFGQAFSPMNNNSTRNFPPKLSQRPHTAPSSTEMFRPSSVSDVPELSKENLSSMLDRIPDLHGRRFSIEYTEPADLTGYPIPSQSNGTNARYPDGVIVDQLPNNIIQHVKRSNNTQLQAALNLSDQSKKIVPFNGNLSELENSSLKVFHHVARPRDRVKQSRPVFSMISSDTDSNDEANTSDEEREIEETKIEFILRSK